MKRFSTVFLTSDFDRFRSAGVVAGLAPATPEFLKNNGATIGVAGGRPDETRFNAI